MKHHWPQEHNNLDSDVSDASRSECTCVRVHFTASLSSSFAFFSSNLRFRPQESEGGLYVCMNTFLGFGREHVERHYRKTGQSVYMHLQRHVKEVRSTPVQEVGLFSARPHSWGFQKDFTTTTLFLESNSLLIAAVAVTSVWGTSAWILRKSISQN